MLTVSSDDLSTPSISTLHEQNKYKSNIKPDSIEKNYQQVNDGDRKKFVCNFPDCQKVFRYKSEIERHVAAHSEFRPHPCTFEGCGKSFKRVDALENHIRSQHTGEAPLTCPHADCQLRFTTDAKLRYHIALHTGEKPYKCSISGCKRSFLTLSQLKQHEKSISVHKSPPKEFELKEYIIEAKSTPSSIVQDDESKDDLAISFENTHKKIKFNTESLDPFRSLLNSRSNQDAQVLKFNEIYSEIEAKFAQRQINQEFAKKRVLDQILTENHILKLKLESSQILMGAIQKQLSKVAFSMPEETRQLIISKYRPGFGFHQPAHPFDHRILIKTEDLHNENV